MEGFSADDYDYDLPAHQIALHPSVPRDAAQLLCLEGNVMQHRRFSELPDLLPRGATLFLNQSAVLPVRLKVHRSRGAKAEVLLLESTTSAHLSDLLDKKPPLQCRALLRPARRIPIGSELSARNLESELHIQRQGPEEVELRWQPEHLSFEEMLLQFGEPPIPPYLKRDLNSKDLENYQCIYSRQKGSIAAPTAGLHFHSIAYRKARAAQLPDCFS